jgi:hypothetical protein
LWLKNLFDLPGTGYGRYDCGFHNFLLARFDASAFVPVHGMHEIADRMTKREI